MKQILLVLLTLGLGNTLSAGEGSIENLFKQLEGLKGFSVVELQSQDICDLETLENPNSNSELSLFEAANEVTYLSYTEQPGLSNKIAYQALVMEFDHFSELLSQEKNGTKIRIWTYPEKDLNNLLILINQEGKISCFHLRGMQESDLISSPAQVEESNDHWF